MNKPVYLDNAATTPIKPEVLEAMMPYLKEQFGNPSSAYTFAEDIKADVENARKTIADFIGAASDEIYFTSGGTESDNWALNGIAFAQKDKGKHIITSKIEHHAVLHTCEYLEKLGYEITYLDVGYNGLVDPQQVREAIRPDTFLISVMFANNEIGTIQPIKEIGEIAHEHGIPFHTDAVQAYGHVRINVNEMNIDLLSVSGHKINAPVGIGFLYIRTGTKIEAFMHGGSQERHKRAGTTNAPGIIGLAKATELADKSLEKRAEYETQLRNYLIERIENEIPYSLLNGEKTNRLPNNANFSFGFIEGESLLFMLDRMSICASSGPACSTGSVDPSHVLTALGLSRELAHGSLRLTLSEDTTKEEIDYTVDSLKKALEQLREASPQYHEFINRHR